MTSDALIKDLQSRVKIIEKWFDEDIEYIEGTEVFAPLYDEIMDIVKRCIDGIGKCDDTVAVRAVDGLVSFANIKIQKTFDEYWDYVNSCIQEVENGKISKKHLHMLNTRASLLGFKMMFWRTFSLVTLGIFLEHPYKWGDYHDYSIESLRALESVIGHNDEIEELCNTNEGGQL